MESWVGDSMATPKDTLAKLHELRAMFGDVHRRGMDCLQRRDFEGFDEALKAERQLIEEQALLIKELREP